MIEENKKMYTSHKNEFKKASSMTLDECIKDRSEKIRKNHPEKSESEVKSLARQRCESRTQKNEMLEALKELKRKIKEDIQELEQARERLI